MHHITNTQNSLLTRSRKFDVRELYSDLNVLIFWEVHGFDIFIQLIVFVSPFVAKKKHFQMMRKMHYNEGLNIKLARQLIASELEDDEDEDEEMRDDTEETEEISVDPPQDGEYEGIVGDWFWLFSVENIFHDSVFHCVWLDTASRSKKGKFCLKSAFKANKKRTIPSIIEWQIIS